MGECSNGDGVGERKGGFDIREEGREDLYLAELISNIFVILR